MAVSDPAKVPGSIQSQKAMIISSEHLDSAAGSPPKTVTADPRTIGRFGVAELDSNQLYPNELRVRSSCLALSREPIIRVQDYFLIGFIYRHLDVP